MAWSAFGRPLEMLTQDCAYLYGEAQAVFHVREASLFSPVVN